MAVLQPKVTGDAAQDSWSFDVTNNVNDLLDGGTGTGAGVESGATLPESGVDGDAFVLLATDGTNLPGYYFYNNDNWVAQSTAPQGASVTAVTSSFDEGVLTVITQIDGVDQAPVESDDLTGPQGPRGQDYTLIRVTDANTRPSVMDFNGADVVYTYIL